MQKEIYFDLRAWNGAYGEMQSIEDSLDFYRTSYEDEVSKKELEKHLISLEAWEEYAYNKKMLLEFTVFLQSNNQIYASGTLNEGNAVVRFIDEHNRIYMDYIFGGEYEEGQLFLERLQYYLYPDEKFHPRYDFTSSVCYDFTPDGGLQITKLTIGKNKEEEVTITEAAHPVNVRSNWEPYPQLGKYHGLVKLKRWEDGGLLEPINPNQPVQVDPVLDGSHPDDRTSKWLSHWNEIFGNKK